MIKLLVNYYYTHVRKLYGESAAYEDTEHIMRRLYGELAAYEDIERIMRKANELMDNKEG